MSPVLSFEIKLHGFLLWASVGFLMPVSILIKRASNREESGSRLRIIFYIHAVTQAGKGKMQLTQNVKFHRQCALVISVLLATAGTVLSIKYFDNSFSNDHQRIGLAFYILMWLQAFLAVFRPQRGSKGRRSIWFIFHWVMGITVSLLGVINMYTGLHAYSKRTSKNVRAWTFVFTVEVSLILFVYLIQEKWLYIRENGRVLQNNKKHLGLVDNMDARSTV